MKLQLKKVCEMQYVHETIDKYGQVVIEEPLNINQVIDRFKGEALAIIDICERDGVVKLFNPETNSY